MRALSSPLASPAVLQRTPAVRFALVGAAVTVLHLVLFTALSGRLVAELANLVAFVLATQVNFAVSHYWTWSARRVRGTETVRSVLRRAVLFNGSAALGFGVNAAVFSLAYRVAGLPSLAGALVATVVSAAASFVLSSRVVFRRLPVPADSVEVPVLPPTLAAPLVPLSPDGTRA